MGKRQRKRPQPVRVRVSEIDTVALAWSLVRRGLADLAILSDRPANYPRPTTKNLSRPNKEN